MLLLTRLLLILVFNQNTINVNITLDYCTNNILYSRVGVGAGALQKKDPAPPKNPGSRQLRLGQPFLNPSVTITTFVGRFSFKKTFRVGKEGCRKEGIQDCRDTGKEEFGMGGI